MEKIRFDDVKCAKQVRVVTYGGLEESHMEWCDTLDPYYRTVEV